MPIFAGEVGRCGWGGTGWSPPGRRAFGGAVSSISSVVLLRRQGGAGEGI